MGLIILSLWVLIGITFWLYTVFDGWYTNMMELIFFLIITCILGPALYIVLLIGMLFAETMIPDTTEYYFR